MLKYLFFLPGHVCQVFLPCQWHHELTPQRTSSSRRTLKVQKTVHQAAEGGVSNGNKCSKSSSPKAAANGSLQPRLCSAECRAGRRLCQCQCQAIRAMAGSAFLSHKVCILCYRISYPTLNCLAFPSFKKIQNQSTSQDQLIASAKSELRV